MHLHRRAQPRLRPEIRFCRVIARASLAPPRHAPAATTLHYLPAPARTKLHQAISTIFPHALLRLGIVCLALVIASTASAAAPVEPTAENLRAAISRSLPLLTAGARGSMEKRERCFTCHNQGLPIAALTAARSRGFAIDTNELRVQLQFTADFLAKNRTNYLAGKGQGGQTDTAGYALWALANGGWKPDSTTAAVAEYLLVWQKNLEHWKPQSRRPPSEGSLFTSTHAALRGLQSFATPEQHQRRTARFHQVRTWLLQTPAQDHEDRVFRLRALHVADAPAPAIAQAAADLLASQRPDGGWAQLPNLESDAYATATALVALLQTDRLAADATASLRGLRYLLTHQLPDGSWHVKTRSKPIQSYYESGYPHGPDQFISITAAGWATTALALALPPSP